MFKNEFQGGSYVEVFSAQGRDPVAKWRLSGSASTKSKVYDKDVKSFVYVLEGETTTTKMTLPKDEKQSLWLIQRYLIVQLFVPLGHSFSLEFGVTDTASNKRRILLSSNHREVIVTHLHARFPLNILRFGVWLNLCLDLNSLVGETFKGQSFKALENLTISASCRLRKIFTMKVQPTDTTDDEQIYGRENTISREVENIPKALQFSSSPDLQHYTQVINMAKLRQAEAKAREVAGLPPPTTPILLESDPASKAGEQPTHIAFGSKVVIPKHARKSSREGGTGSAGSRSSSGLNHSGSIPHLRTASPSTEEDSGRESSRQTHGLYYQRSLSDATDSRTEPLKSRLEVEATQSTMQPRPPRTGSGGRTRRRPLRVRNPGVTKSHTVDDKNVNSAGIKAEVNVNCAKSTVISEKELDNNAKTMYRSQSETSLKISGNNDSLGESFSYLQSNNVKREDQNGHANTSTDQSMIATKTSNDSPPQPVFTFSSRPRSAPRSPRNRQRKPQDSVVQGKTPSDEKPDIQVYVHEPVKIGESKSKADKVRTRRESERSEYDDDFYKASGESSGEEDDWQKLLKTSGNSRCSSRGSRMSPVPGSQTSGSPESDPLSNSQILRMSIRSSLLKEIPSPRKNNTKPYEAKNYQSDASSWRNFESNASSWRFDTSVISNNMLDRSFGKSFSGSYGHDSGFPRERFISSRTSGSEDGIVTNDGGDSLSDSSDDTSYSTWKGPPPPDKRQHRYLDEMRHPGPEPDLSATLPMDPREYSNVFSPPIVLPSQRIGSGQKTTTLSAAAALSPPRSRNVSTSADHDSVSAEEELDLLYDPCLNCYFDPTTHKYYELA